MDNGVVFDDNVVVAAAVVTFVLVLFCNRCC